MRGSVEGMEADSFIGFDRKLDCHLRDSRGYNICLLCFGN